MIGLYGASKYLQCYVDSTLLLTYRNYGHIATIDIDAGTEIQFT